MHVHDSPAKTRHASRPHLHAHVLCGAYPDWDTSYKQRHDRFHHALKDGCPFDRPCSCALLTALQSIAQALHSTAPVHPVVPRNPASRTAPSNINAPC